MTLEEGSGRTAGRNRIVLGSQTDDPAGRNRIGVGVGNDQSVAAAANISGGGAVDHAPGQEPQAAKSNAPGRLPAIVGAGLALIVLFFSVVFDSRAPKGEQIHRSLSNLSASYYDYLTEKRGTPLDEASRRVDSVQKRLIAVSLALASGDNSDGKEELGELLLLDGDNQSPLYRFCVRYIGN